MIAPNKEVNRMPGYAALTNSAGTIDPNIMGGQLVRLVDNSTVTLAVGSLSAVSNSVLGIAADTTAAHAAGGKYVITDDYAKNGLVSVFINGGVFSVWNDGRGAVFASDVINAAAGAPLYVDNSGCWTTSAGSAATVGASALGVVLQAPTSATGVLKLKATI